ncbi:MAG: acyl carrier protein [Gammaproteobacteria bacterium]|nr:acyl carrier protein [Gammaproteobacteria bacterium]
MTDIKSNVRAYISENFLMGLKDSVINDDTSFLDIGIIDSTGVIELITYLEESYGITVEDVEMTPENLDSLSAIESYISRKTMARAAAV